MQRIAPLLLVFLSTLSPLSQAHPAPAQRRSSDNLKENLSPPLLTPAPRTKLILPSIRDVSPGHFAPFSAGQLAPSAADSSPPLPKIKFHISGLGLYEEPIRSLLHGIVSDAIKELHEIRNDFTFEGIIFFVREENNELRFGVVMGEESSTPVKVKKDYFLDAAKENRSLFVDEIIRAILSFIPPQVSLASKEVFRLDAAYVHSEKHAPVPQDFLLEAINNFNNREDNDVTVSLKGNKIVKYETLAAARKDGFRLIVCGKQLPMANSVLEADDIRGYGKAVLSWIDAKWNNLGPGSMTQETRIVMCLEEAVAKAVKVFGTPREVAVFKRPSFPAPAVSSPPKYFLS